MIKLFFVFFLLLSVSYSQVINAIALVVNDDAITIYDIENKMNLLGVSKDEAIGQLVDEVLFKNLISENNISVDIFDVNTYLEKVATSNGMDLYTFKSIIKQKYKDYEAYEKNVKNNIIKQKLSDKLIRGNLKLANEVDLKIYYENNINLFQAAKKIYVRKYASTSKKELLLVQTNPMLTSANVEQNDIILKQDELNSQLRFIINDTKINTFTAIFSSNKKYTTLLIRKKEDLKIIKFEDVRDRIFNIVMQDRERKYLKNFFDRLKLTANIRIVR